MDKHDTLLLSSASSENRKHLRGVFQDAFNLLEASNPQQTLLLLGQNIACIAAVLLDISDREGVDIPLLNKEEDRQLLEKVPVIVLTEKDDPGVLNRVFGFGASDVIPVDYDPYAMLHRVETIIDLHLHKQYLETMVEEQKTALRHNADTMVDALSSIIEYRSVESGQHILRIRHFTKILLEEVARSCPEYRLDERTIAIICSASALHDIGKIAIPDAILMKPGKLTREEWEVMKTHALTGCRILDTLGDMADREYLRYAHNICHYHHERWDGGGYPEGLAGEAIPICAQVVGLADAYDALTSKRVYKDAYSFDRAVNMILRGQCGVFSPKLLECFKHVTAQYEALAEAYADGMSPKSETFDTALPAPEKEQEDSLERIRAKYFALVHYIRGLLLEVDLDRGLFHLIYNPYPELAWVQDITSFHEMGKLLEERIVTPENREEMMRFFRQEIRSFMDQELRRMTKRFRFHSKLRPEGDEYEITLLRVNPIDSSRRSLAVLCRRVEQETSVRTEAENILTYLSDSTFLCRNDQHFTLLELSRHIPRLAGYTREELESRFQSRLLELIHPEDREEAYRSIRQQLKNKSYGETEFRIRRKDGSTGWVLDKFYLKVDEQGQEILSCFMTDITQSKQEFTLMTEKLRRYEIILAQTENVLFEWELDTDRILFSDTWEKIFGYEPAAEHFRESLIHGSSFHPDDVPKLIDLTNRLENGSAYEMAEVRVASARGRYIWCRFRATAIRDGRGKLRKISGIIINIDTEKQAAQLLQSRAEQDSLTKLLNKDAARKQAEEYLSRYPEGVSGALMIIDLDNFKLVNDKYGHLFGDAVLTQAAREIRNLFRNQDIVARIGGDEFLVLVRGISDRQLLEQRCQRLIQIFETTFRSQRYKLPLSCSIGIALSPIHGRSYYDLYRYADQALYQAKSRGKNCFVFYSGEDAAFANQPGSTGVVSNAIDSDLEPGMADDNIVRYAFQKLYSSQDVEGSIQELLSLVGQKMNVSRVYVFENSDDDRVCNNTYEWCNDGIWPEIDNLQNISYETDIPGYADNFDEQGIFYCPDVTILPRNVYDILAPQGIKSMLQCAIRENGVFRGYIGFDECVEQRLWTKEQIALLTYFSESLSMFLLRRRRQEKVQQQADELRSILDNQDAWIYIVEPDTFLLKYVNAHLQERIPDIRPGMHCYRAMKGLSEPCSYCPMAKLGDQNTGSSLKYNEEFGRFMLLDATRIQWNGTESCLMTCKQLPAAEDAEK